MERFSLELPSLEELERLFEGIGGAQGSVTSTRMGEAGAKTETDLACSRAVDALVVAINQASDMRRWYTVTKELQLASLELCGACRGAHTVSLIVGGDTPTTLLAEVDAPRAHPEEAQASRVPQVRARRVTWGMASLDLLNNPIASLTVAEELCFRDAFNGSLEVRAWPRRLRKITFCRDSQFNHQVEAVKWPASLEHLTFGSDFNQPIDGVEWPKSLRRLTFGWDFNQPIDGVQWPESLRSLTFDDKFNQPIGRVTWPASLRQLTFGYTFDRSIAGAVLPPSLLELYIGGDFNRPISRVLWPASLQKLVFGGEFNRPIEGVTWPSSLRELRFDCDFDQPIERVVWPSSLRRLRLGNFNRSIESVTWPTSLQQLRFGRDFNQPLDGMPPLLEDLEVGPSFNQTVDRVQWPSLRRLVLKKGFRQSLQALGTAMPSLERLELYFYADQYGILRGIEWPPGLKHLTMDLRAPYYAMYFPPGVSVRLEE
ncbi:unnamed protein product [Scytosiphon promiscuus]